MTTRDPAPAIQIMATSYLIANTQTSQLVTLCGFHGIVACPFCATHQEVSA